MAEIIPFLSYFRRREEQDDMLFAEIKIHEEAINKNKTYEKRVVQTRSFLWTVDSKASTKDRGRITDGKATRTR